MKKSLFFIIALIVILPIYAQESSNVIDEKEYIEIKNWDIVKVRRDAYLGKRVSVESFYAGIAEGVLGNPPTANLANISYFCTFTDEALDKLLELETGYLHKYLFYGVVIVDVSGMLALHIENVR